MVTITAVETGRAPRAPRVVDSRPMTEITGKVFRETFVRPAARDGVTQRQMWECRSVDGLWSYERFDDGEGSPWVVTYRPTGQRREGYGTSATARRETAGGLVDELRAEAFVAALAGPVEYRQDGQRWLAVHMRIAGADEAEARCVCGGMLVRATRRGDWGHVDGCRQCYQHGEGLLAQCIDRSAHLFCGRPTPIECSHWMDRARVCGELAQPNAGEGCGAGKSGDCCTACCNGE